MTCLQPETGSRDKIQHPIQSNSKTKVVPAQEIQMEFSIHVQAFKKQTLSWTEKVTTNKFHW